MADETDLLGTHIANDDVDLPLYDERDYEFDDEDEDDEDDVPFMQNRELSWLTFNERVLDQGADESVPLLERLNFISIFWSNLQEFFMVRVGSLTDLSFIEPPVIDSKTGMTPKEQIQAIHERCHELYPIQESYYEHVRGSLAKQGVRHLRPEDLSDEQRNYLFGLVKHNIEPFLSPQIINARHPFPHIENGKLYILVRLDDDTTPSEGKKKDKKKGGKKKDKGGAEGVLLGLIPLPHQCERVIKLPGRGFQFILLEHAIEMFVPEIFSMYKIKHTNVICVTRNADIDANQGFDEQDEDYREHMKRLLKQRARLAPVRLECERPLSPVMEKLMLKKLGLKRYQVYDTIVPLDLGFTWGLGSRLSESKREKLSNAPFTPAWPTSFDKNRRILDQVTEHETLMFYPYESMDPFVQLLREASVDPSVVSIKITLYRLASQSHLAEALIAAADGGKEVTALFELRARFDENNNIEWSQRFEEAGCNVIYGFRDYKVHSKICCITRRMPDGSLQHITQLGTGNYNEKTARLYTDLSFITTDEAFGRDAVEFFRNMQLENVSDNYNVLRVAPLQIKPMILDNLDKQIELARAGKPAYAFLKANSVTDKDVIEKISEASNAGVSITLFVRGICCLVPGVKGATENVRVVSIVGRLLEHSRIYCFGTNEDCIVYLSSADLMTRNLNKRVEIAWPINDPALRNRILTYIDICMHDTAKLRELRPNATYTPLGAFCDLDEDGNPHPAFDAQNTLIEQAAQAALAVSQQAEATAQNADSQVDNAPLENEVATTPEPVSSEQSQPIAQGAAAELMQNSEPVATVQADVVNEPQKQATEASEPSVEPQPSLETSLESPVAQDAATSYISAAIPPLDFNPQQSDETPEVAQEPAVENDVTPIAEEAPQTSPEVAQVIEETPAVQESLEMAAETVNSASTEASASGSDPVIRLDFSSPDDSVIKVDFSSGDDSVVKLDFSQPSESSPIAEAAKPNSTVEMEPITSSPTVDASARVAELRDQLGTNGDQQTARTYDTASGIQLPQLNVGTDPASQAIAAAASGQSSSFGVAQANIDPENQTPAGMPNDIAQSTQEVFQQSTRTIEMPPEKKPGFFSRFFGKKN